MRPGRGWAVLLGIAGLAALTGCAVEPAPPSRDDLGRLRTDIARLEQVVQKGQADLKADLQRSDRQSAQTLTEVQRSVAQLGNRLDELGRETSQIQGRLDEIRRRLEALTVQPEGQAPGVSQPARPAPAAPRAEPTRPATPPLAPTPAPRAAAPTAQPPVPPRQAVELYQTAYIDFTRGNYNLALAAFREFIRLHPDTDLAEKAQYWIGESHFSLARGHQARGDSERATPEFERAVQEFRRVLINYPRGDRVASALYKEALALLEIRQPVLAEARLQFLVDQFPASEEAAKAKDDLGRLRKR